MHAVEAEEMGEQGRRWWTGARLNRLDKLPKNCPKIAPKNHPDCKKSIESGPSRRHHGKDENKGLNLERWESRLSRVRYHENDRGGEERAVVAAEEKSDSMEATNGA